MSAASMCGDNRFELIAKARAMLVEDTNIEDRPDEMAVLDSILFRCWQMGWLDRLGAGTCNDTGESRIFHCSECGLGLGDVYIDDERRYSPDDFPRFCPWCGAKVVNDG